MLKETVKSLVKKAGFRISRNYFGLEHWDDIATLVGPDPKIIFDVGANVGQTAARLVEAFPSAYIHCFEPFPQSFESLQKAVAGNPRVVAQNMGLGAEEGQQSLYVHPGSEWNSMFKPSADLQHLTNSYGWPVSHGAGSVSVEISTLDAYCFENKIEQIDLLKIDTQGYELSVLKGARRECPLDRRN